MLEHEFPPRLAKIRNNNLLLYFPYLKEPPFYNTYISSHIVKKK